mgnify:CR=1 FL=1
MAGSSRPVYSTELGRLCPACGAPQTGCLCKAKAAAAAVATGDGVARVRLETKGRKGKGVTVIAGVPLTADELARLGTQLKQRCGSGGTVKDGVIEIQGDHRDTVLAELARQGFRAKRAGG